VVTAYLQAWSMRSLVVEEAGWTQHRWPFKVGTAVVVVPSWVFQPRKFHIGGSE